MKLYVCANIKINVYIKWHIDNFRERSALALTEAQ